MSVTSETVLSKVLDQWKSAVDAHESQRAAELFTDDALFQGLHPYTIGRSGVADYYESQPLGMTADYRLLEASQLADDLILGYLTVDFGFVDRPTLTVYLSILLRRVGDAWLIRQYQVSLLP